MTNGIDSAIFKMGYVADIADMLLLGNIIVRNDTRLRTDRRKLTVPLLANMDCGS